MTELPISCIVEQKPAAMSRATLATSWASVRAGPSPSSATGADIRSSRGSARRSAARAATKSISSPLALSAMATCSGLGRGSMTAAFSSMRLRNRSWCSGATPMSSQTMPTGIR